MNTENPKNFSTLTVKWIDSATPADGGWQEVDDIEDLKLTTVGVYTIGYLLHENEHRIVVCNSYFEQDPPSTSISCLGLISIPRVSIVALEYINKAAGDPSEEMSDGV